MFARKRYYLLTIKFLSYLFFFLFCIRLNDRADELAELKLSLRDVKRRTEEQDRNLDFNQKRHQNEVQALKHECESAHEAVSARDKEISFMRGKLEDLERSLGEQRREMMLRDERLDKRHAEVQSWTSECDRLRLQLEQTRQRNIDTAKDHEARVNELKSSERELLSRISSIEVQRASSIFVIFIFFTLVLKKNRI